MKNLVLLIPLFLGFVACKNQVNKLENQIPQETQFEKYNLLKSDNQIDTVRLRYLLTNTDERIEMTPEEMKNVITEKDEGRPYNEVEYALFNIIQYRYFSRLKFEENKVVNTVKNGVEIGIPEDFFQDVNGSIIEMNKMLAKADKETIKKQFEYLHLLIKNLEDFNSHRYNNNDVVPISQN